MCFLLYFYIFLYIFKIVSLNKNIKYFEFLISYLYEVIEFSIYTFSKLKLILIIFILLYEIFKLKFKSY